MGAKKKHWWGLLDVADSREDIQPLMRRWQAYDPSDLTVRLVAGVDGAVKFQMRLDLGLIQMEPDGRPDGQRPHGYDSLLEYVESEVEQRSVVAAPIEQRIIDEVPRLRDELTMYYHRFLAAFVLEVFEIVLRDIRHAFKIVELAARLSVDHPDTRAMQALRPYLTMMEARTRAMMLLAEDRVPEAHELINTAIAEVRKLLLGNGEKDPSSSSEIKILEALREQSTTATYRGRPSQNSLKR